MLDVIGNWLLAFVEGLPNVSLTEDVQICVLAPLLSTATTNRVTVYAATVVLTHHQYISSTFRRCHLRAIQARNANAASTCVSWQTFWTML